MSLFERLRGRRLLQIVGGYAAAGWLALEAADQLVDRGILPEIVYPVFLTLYLTGLPASATIGWFHGKKGAQKAPPLELGLLTVMAVAGLGVSAFLVHRHVTRTDPSIADVAAAGLNPNRIAVLYLHPADRQVEYLADGFTEALIDELGQTRALDVVSRNGVSRYRDTSLPRDSIARALGAGTLIAGGLEPIADRLRLTVQLVDGASGAEFRRESFEAPESELLSLQQELADRVGRLLREWLGEEIRLRRTRAGTESVAAWALVQRAERSRKEAEDALDAGDGERGLALYEHADSLLARAVSLDTLWARPVALRGWIAYRESRYAAQARHDLHATVELIGRGLQHAERAIARERRNADALELRGTLRYWTWLLHVTPDPAERDRLLRGAREDLESAVEIDPTRASAYSTLSHLYYQVEDVSSVVLAAQRAYEEDAYLAVANDVLWRLFNGLHDLGSFRQAQGWCRVGAERFPHDYRFRLCQLWLMTTPAVQPDPDAAWELLARVDSLAPDPQRPYVKALGQMIVGGVLAREGLVDSARSVLVRARAAADHTVDPTGELLAVEAFMRTLLADRDTAIALLKRFVAANPEHYFEVGGEISWRWRSLLNEPEFRELMSPR